MGCNCKKQPTVINPQPTPEPVVQPEEITDNKIEEDGSN